MAHLGSQLDLSGFTWLQGELLCRKKSLTHTLFGWISSEVWPQGSNSGSKPLRQEEKSPLFRLKGVVVTFKSFLPSSSLFGDQPWDLVFLSHYGTAGWHFLLTWINNRTALIQHFQWDSLPSERPFSMMDGADWELGAHQSCQGPCRELTLEKVSQLSCRESRQGHVSLKDSHTPHWDTTGIPGGF